MSLLPSAPPGLQGVAIERPQHLPIHPSPNLRIHHRGRPGPCAPLEIFERDQSKKVKKKEGGKITSASPAAATIDSSIGRERWEWREGHAEN